MLPPPEDHTDRANSDYADSQAEKEMTAEDLLEYLQTKRYEFISKKTLEPAYVTINVSDYHTLKSYNNRVAKMSFIDDFGYLMGAKIELTEDVCYKNAPVFTSNKNITIIQ